MSQNVTGLAGYLGALVFAGLCFYLWTRYKILAAQQAQVASSLANTAQDLERQRKLAKNFEASILTKQQEFAQLLKEKEGVEKSCKQLKEELSTFKAAEETYRAVENQLEHYKTQTEVLLGQLTEIDSERASLKALYEKERESHGAELEKSVGSLREDHQKLASRNEHLEKRLNMMQTQYLQLKAREHEGQESLQLLKRKVHQSDHLFKTIRGQKEMLDERLQNWETALRILGSWILKDKGHIVDPNQKLGEVVAKALQLTHQGPLFVDDGPMDSMDKEKEEDATANS